MAKRLDPSNQRLASRKSGAARLPAGTQAGEKNRADWVAVQLRELYGEVTREPVPDSLLELLRKLKDDDGG